MESSKRKRDSDSEANQASETDIEKRAKHAERIILFQQINEESCVTWVALKEEECKTQCFEIKGKKMSIEEILTKWAKSGPMSVCPANYVFTTDESAVTKDESVLQQEFMKAVYDCCEFNESTSNGYFMIDTTKVEVCGIYTCSSYQ